MMQLDRNPDVIFWSSEEVIVPYTNPFDDSLHRYFPDFVVWKKLKDGIIQISMIEIKPHAQSIPPKIPVNVKSKKYLREVQTWGINSAKWAAARRYCVKRGWIFQILTEKELGLF